MAVATVFVGAYLAAVSCVPEYLLTDARSVRAWRPKADYEGIRFLVDYWDLDEHLQRGSWVRFGCAPYRDVKSEYPQVATYAFGVPHLLGASRDSRRFVYSAMMLAAMLGLLAATRALLARLGKPRARLLLLCLPSALYFAANRYDVLVAALVAASLLLLFDGRGCWALAVLGLAVLTKWYPAVLAPLYLAHLYTRRGRVPWREAAAGAGVIAALMLHTLWWAGWEGMLAPYKAQFGIGANAESLYGLLRTCGLSGPAWKWPFTALQFSVLLVAFLVRVRTRGQLLDAMAFAVMAFLSFSIRHSPQWILWISPLLVLTARGRADIAIVVVYDLLTYLYFPLGYDLYEGTRAWTAILVVHACFRVFLLARLGGRVAWAWQSPRDEPQAAEA